MVALEPDFHFKPQVELYNLVEDPDENHNLADELPEVVTLLKKRMTAWIRKRVKETGKRNPMLTQGGTGTGHEGRGCLQVLAAGLRHNAYRRSGPGGQFTGAQQVNPPILGGSRSCFGREAAWPIVQRK